MKITKSQLREIIKEEAIRVLSEMGPSEEDRELAAALSSELEKMPEGPEKEELRKQIRALVLTPLGGNGKEMQPQLYSLSRSPGRQK